MSMKNTLAIFILFLSLPLCATTPRSVLPWGKGAVRTTVNKQTFNTLRATASSQFARRLQRQTAGLLLKNKTSRYATTQINPPETALNRDVFAQWLERHYPKNVSAVLEQKNLNLISQIKQTWKGNERFLQNWLFENLYSPLPLPTPFSLKNNRIILASSRRFFEKMRWLKKLPGQGHDDMVSYSGDDAVHKLAQKLVGEKLILLGEMHHMQEIHFAISDLLEELQRLCPGRRIVLFTELIDLPNKTPAPGATLSTYYRRPGDETFENLKKDDPANEQLIDYAPYVFYRAIYNDIEVYPLEDKALFNMIRKEQGPLYRAETSALAIAVRNKSWARFMETKMAEIRQTDPDALFLVYAGMAHTSWLMPYAIGKFFASENPTVVEIASTFPSDLTGVYAVWTENDPFFALRQMPSLHYWKGADARLLGKNTGFDYTLILPSEDMSVEPW